MSEPNLSQILAALTAQKGDGSRGQPSNQQAGAPNMQQSTTPSNYQQPYPVPTPPANTGTYSFPPPASSGNYDLSNIKPANSGSLNFGDSGRTRSSGDRHGQYEHGYGSPRRGVRSRSRSRSPPRGGRYTDSYNPYRDGRRDDPRRSNGQRDRSLSPSRRYHDQPSRGYSGDQDHGSDPNMETIIIDSGLVGLIIGRSGENLRRVEIDTGTRVQFQSGPENSGPYRHCKILGPRQAREAAKNELNRIIAESGKSGRILSADHVNVAEKSPPAQQPTAKPGEDSKQIMVPDRTVGLIIGRGGETIRDLQERSGCHVNITSEDKSVNGLRPVNLIGTTWATNKAKDLIMEIVDSDNKGQASGGGGGGGGGGQGGGGGGSSGGGGSGANMMPRGGGGGSGGGDDKINDTIRVPSEAVGMIIGKGGETIKDMQTVTGCKINIPQWSGQGPDVERITGLIGTRSAVEAAKRAIMEKVRAVEDKNRGGSGRQSANQDQQYDRYAQPDAQASNYYQGQSQQYGNQGQAQGQGGAQAPASGDADPYAAYGGYQNYVNMWYAAMQHQAGQSGQQGGGSGAPPAT